VACHFGDGLSRHTHDPSGTYTVLDAIAEAGYDGVRTWTVLRGDYWRNREVGPWQSDYWEDVANFRDALRRRGLRWLVSQGDLMRALPELHTRHVFMAQLAGMLTLEDVIGVDAGNEAWQNGEADPARLGYAMQAFRTVLPVPVWSLTDAGSEEPADLLRYAGSVGDVHSYRGGRWYDKVRHIWNNAYEGISDCPVVQSEPAGPGQRVSVTENKHELDADALHAMAVAAAMSGQLWVYFSGPGVISDEGERMADMPGFATTPAVLARLPRDVGAGERVHGGDRFRDRRVFAASGDMRAEHSLLNDGRFVALLYGPHLPTVQAAQPQRNIEVAYDRTDSKARVVIGRVR